MGEDVKRATTGVTATLLIGGCLATASPDAAEMTTQSWKDALGAEITNYWSSPEHRSFDFWIGEWEMNWRARPEGEFHHQKEGSWTRQRVFPILGGKAILELAWARDNPEEASQRGFSIRYFDPARERWVMAQNWPNANNTGSAFLDQLIGDEHLGRLTMYSITQRRQPDADPVVEHRRYNFADIRPGVSFRWDGSNTPDDGATWRTWSIVDAHRKRDLDPFTPAGGAFPGVHERMICTGEAHRAFDGLRGAWTGAATEGDGAERTASFVMGDALDGCGGLGVLEIDGARTFLALGFAERRERWVIYALDDRPNSPHTYYITEDAGEGAAFNEAPQLAIKDEFTPFVADENFDASAAGRRMVFETIAEGALALRFEERRGGGEPWTLKSRIDLSPA